VIKKKNISDEDTNVWEEYIKNPSDVFDKDKNNECTSLNKKRFKFDLHGFSLQDANDKVEEIIFRCLKENYREILLITGKGIHSNIESNVYASKNLSKLRFSVPEFIKSKSNLSKNIASVSKAHDKDGGDGAVLIKLKKL